MPINLKDRTYVKKHQQTPLSVNFTYFLPRIHKSLPVYEQHAPQHWSQPTQVCCKKSCNPGAC